MVRTAMVEVYEQTRGATSKRYSIGIYLKSVMRKEGSFLGSLEDARSLRNSSCPSGASILVTSWSACSSPCRAGPGWVP